MTEVIHAAGKFLLSQTVAVNNHKTRNDLLTQNDLETEEFIIAHLKETHPDIHIVSEEYNPDSTPEGLTVVIDPIDGTCNYAVGLSMFGIQLALFDGSECVGAVLHFPVSGDTFTARLGEGAYLNGKRISVNPDTPAGDGILLISDYYDGMDISMQTQFDLVRALQSYFLKTRHLGAACVDFTTLAKGHALAYITYYSKLWDIAPGLLLAKEAGCVAGYLPGGDYPWWQPGLVVATNADILSHILSTYNALPKA